MRNINATTLSTTLSTTEDRGRLFEQKFATLSDFIHALRTRPDWINALIFAVFLMNALDGVMTITWVSTAIAVEANPLMAFLLNIHPALFMIAKITLVFGGLLTLLHFRERTEAIIGILSTFFLYYLLILYHLIGVGQMLV